MKIKARLEKLEQKVVGEEKLIVTILIFGKEMPLPEPQIGDKVDVLYAYADDVDDAGEKAVGAD
jgi:hypothetical protein